MKKIELDFIKGITFVSNNPGEILFDSEGNNIMKNVDGEVTLINKKGIESFLSINTNSKWYSAVIVQFDVLLGRSEFEDFEIEPCCDIGTLKDMMKTINRKSFDGISDMLKCLAENFTSKEIAYFLKSQYFYIGKRQEKEGK